MNYDGLKKVLFGNQKQGDAINTAVAQLIGVELEKHGIQGDWPSAIKKYTEVVTSGAITPNKMVLSLIYGAGILGCELLNNLTFNMYQPYDDSPKWVFELVDANGTSYSLDKVVEPVSTPLEEVKVVGFKSDYDYLARAKAVKNKIYSLVPTSIKSEFEGELGEWQAALLFAEEYYK